MKPGLEYDKTLDGALPEARRILLNRDRLLALDDGSPILVIEGPSGYGKTVLAEMWLERQRKQARCCWISVDASSRDPILFLEQLQRAVGGESPVRQEAGIDDEADRAERFSSLCARLDEEPSGLRLVVDDAHALAGSPSLSYLAKLLTLASGRLRICLTLHPGLIDLGLGRMTAQGQASWIPAVSLALTREEIETFAGLRGQPLTQEQLDWLYRATEGWPALTQLALAMPISDNPGGTAVVGGSGPLRSYIYERFVRGLSPDDQDILWTLCCLGSAPIPLLISLNPPPAKVELALLHFRALGIVQNRDPDDSSVVSLHGLVREAASRLMETDHSRSRRDLVSTACDWYWRNGHGAEAVRLALEVGSSLAPQARDWLVELGFGFIFHSGQHQTYVDLVQRWEQVAGKTDPEVDSTVAWALIFQRQFALAQTRLARIEANGKLSLLATASLQRSVLTSLRDDFTEGGALAQRWITQNQGVQSFDLGVASTVYAFSLKCRGAFDEAHVELREAMYCFNIAQSAYGIGWAHVVGALVLLQAGRYRAALAQVEGGLTRCPATQGFGSLRTLLKATEAFLRYERNEIDRVREILDEALPLLSEQGVVDSVSVGYAAAARARASVGDFGTALDILSEGELIGLQRDFPRLALILKAERALLLIRSGSVSQARAIIDAFPPSNGVRTTLNLLKARIALADGDGHRALEQLAPIHEKARRLGRQSRLCEILLLQAQAEELCGQEAKAFSSVGEALDIGSTEGYLRCFLDEGKSLCDLIERWTQLATVSSRPATALAQRLLNTDIGGKESEEPDSKANDITLNRRERQLLMLLNEGLSNAQLAKRCFISEGTVKWYLHNLYEKFDVGNRTALLRAIREKGVKLR